MKTMKKLCCIVLALVMVMGLAISASAAESAPPVGKKSTVTLPEDAKDHTMVAYQIFKGEQLPGENSNSAQLGVTGWGDGVNVDELLKALGSKYNEKLTGETDKKFETGMSAWDAAQSLNKIKEGMTDQKKVELADIIAANVIKDKGQKFDENGQAVLENGYWVIIDESEPLPGEEGQKETRSTVLLEVVGQNLTLKDKIDSTPKVEKKVDDEDAVVKGLNDVVTYTITVTLPERYGDYQDYVITFHDSMDPGLTIDADSFTLTVPGVKDPIKVEATITEDSKTGTTFTYTTGDLKTAYPDLTANAEIVLTYTAKVNENAVVRNENDAWVDYTNDPDGTGTGTGTTTPDKVIVFTFEIDGNKVDGEGKPLEGAGFTLYKYNEETGIYEKYRDEVTVEINDDTGKSEFKFGQLGVGKYQLVETTVPAGYNKANDIFFEIKETKDDAGNVTGAEILDKDGKKIMDDVAINFGEKENTTEGVISEEVTNKEGLTLPETGGIGTTIFYTVGGILVVAAIVLLVTKKRMSKAQ